MYVVLQQRGCWMTFQRYNKRPIVSAIARERSTVQIDVSWARLRQPSWRDELGN